MGASLTLEEKERTSGAQLETKSYHNDCSHVYRF